MDKRNGRRGWKEGDGRSWKRENGGRKKSRDEIGRGRKRTIKGRREEERVITKTEGTTEGLERLECWKWRNGIIRGKNTEYEVVFAEKGKEWKKEKKGGGCKENDGNNKAEWTKR